MALTKVSYSMIEGQYVNALDFGADPTGSTDSYAALQAAVTAAAGRVVYVPAGTYLVSDTLSYSAPANFGFTSPGIKIVGDGMTKTFFDHRAANKPLIDIDSRTQGGSYTAQMGAVLMEFAIINTAATAGATGIRVVNAYQVKIDHLYIKGMTLDGIEMANGLYVDDGWNMISVTSAGLILAPAGASRLTAQQPATKVHIHICVKCFSKVAALQVMQHHHRLGA